MSLAIPIVATGGGMTAGAQVFGGSTGAPPTADQSIAAVQGTGSLSAPHNTPLHVAGVLVFAGVVILAIHLAGFRFSFDVGAGRG